MQHDPSSLPHSEPAAGGANKQQGYRWAVLAAGFLGQASYAAVLVGPAAIAPVLQQAYHLSLPVLGLVLAASSVGSLLTLFAWGVVADRLGERIVLATGMLATAAVLLGPALVVTPAVLLIALAAAGALGAGVNSASGRAVTEWFEPRERGLALGIRQTATPAGGAVAALTLPRLVHGADARLAFVFLSAACIAAALGGAVVLRTRGQLEQRSERGPLRDSRLWRLGAGCTLLVLAQISVLTFLPLLLHRHRGLSLADAGAVLAVTQAFGAGGRILAGWASDLVGARLRLIRVVARALVVALLFTTFLVDGPLPLLLPALVVAGALGLSWNGLAFTATVEYAGSGRSGSAIGFQQTLLALGSALAPIMFATLTADGSWRLAFGVMAFVPVLGLVVLAPLGETRIARA